MAKKQVSYLSQLRFDKSLWNSLQAKWILNIRVVIMLIIAIVALGFFSLTQIPRRLNPEIKIPIVTIATVLPGANPSDVESLVTIPIEDSLEEIDGIDMLASTSREGLSVVVIQFLSSVEGDQARSDVQSAVESVTDLPEDAIDPRVELLDFENQPVWTFVITTNEDAASLMRFSNNLKEQIEDVGKIDQVTLSGFDEQEIQVIVNPAKVAEYNINPALVSQAVQRATSSYPAGSIESNGSSFSLSIDKDILTIEDIRSLRISNGQASYALGDIAEIVQRSKLNQADTLFADNNITPRKTVQFFVYKTASANIDAAEKEAKDIVDEVIADYHGQFTVTTVENTAELINEQFNDLFGEFGSTILLVFVLLIVFLGIRQAVIASLTVPLTFLAAITIMNYMGLSLNFLTMFAFLIALGLLIDDTIVVVAAMTRYYKTGKFTAEETGLLVWHDFIVPLWSTTITTIWAFVPLLIASGIIGEFIKSIPIVVTATMISSTSIAVLITLPLMVVILKPKIPRRVKIFNFVLAIIFGFSLLIFFLPKNIVLPIIILAVVLLGFIVWNIRNVLMVKTKKIYTDSGLNSRLSGFWKRIQNGFVNIELLSEKYKASIERILPSKSARRSTITFITIFAIVGYLLVPLGFVKNEFFPKTDEEILYVAVDLPSGNSLKASTDEMELVMNRLRVLPDVTFIIGEAGTKLDANFDRAEEPDAFLMTVHLTPPEDRDVESQDVAQSIRELFVDYDKGEFTVVEVTGGPPAGADVQLTLLGDELSVLNEYADKLVAFLEDREGVTNIDKSIESGTSKLVFVPDKAKMTANNITIDQIALWLRTYATGFTLDTLTIDNAESDIVFRLSDQNQTPEMIESIMMPTQNGTVQLASLGSVRLETNPTLITRESGKRTITVSAALLPGYTSTEENEALLKYSETLDLPEGYAWQTGGVNEENQRSVNSILQAMIISFLLILITMVIEFRSFRQTLIALLIIPLAVSGVFYVFALTGTPLSFPALIGILALFGIVVTHAIVVIEKINDNRAHGMELYDAIVDGATSRLEPVLLTSLATIAGLIPITVADPLWRGLGGAIIAGLLFSGAIKLFFVPVLYYSWYKDEKVTKN